MRVTTSTAATLTVAGLAALVTGCSSASSTGSGPVVPHRPVTAAPAAAKTAAKSLTPKQQLAAAIRRSLAAHTVQFRYRDGRTLVDASGPENVNPYFSSAGIANFDKNLVTVYTVLGAHANQPYDPMVSEVIDQDSVFFGLTDAVLSSGKWVKHAAGPGAAADVQLTQIMQDVKSVRIASQTKNGTVFQLQADLSKMLIDQGSSSSDPVAKALAGTTQSERVWVNRDGRVARARWTIDPGKVHVPGLSPSVVKAAYITIDFTDYGVDMVVPPHATA